MGYYCEDLCSQVLSKITQSGHTVLESAQIRLKMFYSIDPSSPSSLLWLSACSVPWDDCTLCPPVPLCPPSSDLIPWPSCIGWSPASVVRPLVEAEKHCRARRKTCKSWTKIFSIFQWLTLGQWWWWWLMQLQISGKCYKCSTIVNYNFRVGHTGLGWSLTSKIIACDGWTPAEKGRWCAALLQLLLLALPDMASQKVIALLFSDWQKKQLKNVNKNESGGSRAWAGSSSHHFFG